MDGRLVGYAFLALAMVGVGSTVVASKVIAAGLPPFTATALRFALALPVFVALMVLTGTRWPRPGRRDGLLLVLQAGAGSVGYTVLLVAGTGLTSAGDAAVIAGTLPVVSTLFAVLVLGERPGQRLLAAVALATSGVLAVVAARPGGPPAADLSGQVLLGDALVLGAVVCESLFILLNKRLSRPPPPLAQSALMTGIGLVLAAGPALLVERAWVGPAWAGDAAAHAALAGVAYYALVPTVGGFLLWYAGAARVSGTEASLFTALVPVSALALAAPVLGETPGPAQLAGAALVLGAVALAAGGGRGRRPSGDA